MPILENGIVKSKSPLLLGKTDALIMQNVSVCVGGGSGCNSAQPLGFTQACIT